MSASAGLTTGRFISPAITGFIRSQWLFTAANDVSVKTINNSAGEVIAG
jgi:hypothetical protein